MDKTTNLPARARTGLYSKSESALRIRGERVRRIVANMQRAMPWLQPSDRPAMKGWAELEILSATVFAWLVRMNVINGQGDPRRLLSEHRQLKLAQLAYERELGMTPAARKALETSGGVPATIDVTEAIAERVLEVGRNRGKATNTTEDGEENGSQTYRVTRRPASGRLIGRKGHRQRRPAQAMATTIASYSRVASSLRSPTAERPAWPGSLRSITSARTVGALTPRSFEPKRLPDDLQRHKRPPHPTVPGRQREG